MSIRKFSFMPGEFYHVYNRGNSKQKIFHTKSDYEHFISLLYLCNTNLNLNLYISEKTKGFDRYSVEREDLLVDIGAYCLMPNHFHLLLTECEEGGVSKFMQKLSTAYVMYYNKKYSRTGGLFEGKFKSQYIDNDTYLKYIFSYIHLNPIKLIQKNWKEEGIQDREAVIKYLNNYEYSSYLDFLGNNRIQGSIINTKPYPNYFENKSVFQNEIFDWLLLDHTL